MATIYNVFPIRIGGVKIISFPQLDDFSDTGNFPLCICPPKGVPPIPRVGIKISLWQPIALTDVTTIPGCSPTLGLDLPSLGFANLEFGQKHQGDQKGPNKQNQYTFQTHWFKFPLFAILDLFDDFICLQFGGFDLAYDTEFDPMWQNDMWSLIRNPDALLVANPIANLLCGADAIASNVGFPLDPLFWCAGSWGVIYPLSQVSQSDFITSTALSDAKQIFLLHREMLLWGSIGKEGLCGQYPMPIWIKSQYNLLNLYPVPFPWRQPIGRSTMLLWGIGHDIPVVNSGVVDYAIYQKTDCCAF